MSPLVTRPPSLGGELLEERLRPPAEPKDARAIVGLREPFSIFALAFAFYAAVGLYSTLGLDIVLGDAQSRLAHAYFVLWNDPGKLTAIGFYWPPLQTLVLLPLAAVKPLATSLAALPLTSAVFAAGTLVVLDRALALAEIDRALRWALLAAFGLNPMIVYFAGNGMAESLYLFFLTTAFYLYVRWTVKPRWYDLPLAGLAFSFGVLSRYEVAFWLPLVAVGVVAVQMRRREDVAKIEAALLSVVIPVIYGLMLWTYVTWSITGDPTAYLAVASRPDLPPAGTATELTLQALVIHLTLFPAAPLLAGILLALAVARRSVVALVLSGALLLNALSTIVFLVRTLEDVPLLLRYNMRAMPLSIVALSWLLVQLAPRRRRLGALTAIAVLLLAIPATAATMATARYQLGEAAFLEAIRTGASQNGQPGPRGPGIDVKAQKEMAEWIRAHVPGRDTILADDSQSFGVMLQDGNPERYLDRVDISDERWAFVRDHPVGRVRYLLVQRGATRGRDPVFYDRILDAYPTLGTGEPPPSLRLVHENGKYLLYAVSR